MAFFNNIANDFTHKFLVDVKLLDIVLAIILVTVAIITFCANMIARKITADEKKALALAIKIKVVCLLVVAVAAILITQI
jgi:hypothetical protein